MLAVIGFFRLCSADDDDLIDGTVLLSFFFLGFSSASHGFSYFFDMLCRTRLNN